MSDVKKPHITIGISSRALFDMREGDALWQDPSLSEQERIAKYRALMESKLAEPLGKGAAFNFIEKLLAYNTEEQTLVTVKIISRADPVVAYRIATSLEPLGLLDDEQAHRLVLASFTNGFEGKPIANYLKAHDIEFYISTDKKDVEESIEAGIPAVLVGNEPPARNAPSNRITIYYDFDGVIAHLEEELTFQRLMKEHGLQKALVEYRKHMHQMFKENKASCLGPFGTFAQKLDAIAKFAPEKAPKLQQHILTARQGAPFIHMLYTLEVLGMRDLFDERHSSSAIMGQIPKGKILRDLGGADLFLDDGESHVNGATQNGVLAGRILWAQAKDGPIGTQVDTSKPTGDKKYPPYKKPRDPNVLGQSEQVEAKRKRPRRSTRKPADPK